MVDFTNFHLSNNLNNSIQNQDKLLSKDCIKNVSQYLDKLTGPVIQVSSESVKRVIDFAYAYKVIPSKNMVHIEMVMN